ncbi:MAG: hypothetical protein ACP5E5_11435 [Acidobacteriaceae bacterium]
MAVHPEPIAETAAVDPSPLAPNSASSRASKLAPVWLQRMSLVVLVLFCFYIGALLAVLPWSPRYWDQNGWLLAHPSVQNILNTGWARGVISGIGLLDVWIGVSELLHYRDYRG